MTLISRQEHGVQNGEYHVDDPVSWREFRLFARRIKWAAIGASLLALTGVLNGVFNNAATTYQNAALREQNALLRYQRIGTENSVLRRRVYESGNAMDSALAAQIASFHPDYQFAGVPEDDKANWTNRSPYPLLHLIRESMISAAMQSYPDLQHIPERNINTLRALSDESMKKIFGARYHHETG